MTNQKVNTRYSPEARDIYFTVPNLISALRIISIPFISVLISKHEMIAALALIAIPRLRTDSTASSRADSTK